MKKYIPVALAFAAPFVAFAQNLQSLLSTVQNLLNAVIPILITLAVVYFFWGLAQYIWNAGDDAKKEGRQRMIWGLVALFVMVSVWGIISLFGSTFNIQQGGSGANLIPRVQ